MTLVLGCGLAALGCGEAGYDEEVGTVAEEIAIASVDHRAVGTASWGTDRADIVGRNTSNQAMHQALNLPGQWTGYNPLANPIGEDIRGTPAVVGWGVDRLDIVARSSANTIKHKKYTSQGWVDWATVPNGLMSHSPALVSWGANRLDLFVRGANGDDNLYHSAFVTNAWSIFTDLGGNTEGSPAAAATQTNRLDVAVKGTDNRLYHQRWNGSAWSGLVDRGGDIRDSPSMTKIGSDNIAIAARGANGSVWVLKRLAGIWTWQDTVLDPLASGATGSPMIVSRAAGQYDVITCATDDQVWTRNFNGTTWGSWTPAPGGNCQGSPAAVVSKAKSGADPGRYHVFIRDRVTGKTETTVVTAPAPIGGHPTMTVIE